MEYLIEDETRVIPHNGKFYRLQFYVDSDVSAPWDDVEGFLPCVVLSFDYGSRTHIDDHSGPYDIFDPFEGVTPQWVARNRHAIAETFGPAPTGHNCLTNTYTRLWDSAESFDAYVLSEFDRDYHGSLAEYRLDLFRELLSELGDSDRFETIAAIWQLRGVPALNSATRGYSQGDYAETLIVAHPDWIKAMGFKSVAAYRKACPNDLTNANAAIGAYQWGGCVGYIAARLRKKDVKRLVKEHGELKWIPESELNRLDPKEEIDSCWGFYPEHDSDYFPLDRNHAYAIGEAMNAIHAE